MQEEHGYGRSTCCATRHELTSPPVGAINTIIVIVIELLLVEGIIIIVNVVVVLKGGRSARSRTPGPLRTQPWPPRPAAGRRR